MYIQHNTEMRSSNTVAVESNSITYSECISVALGIQHALCVHHIVICALAVTKMFTHYPINGTI